jgi:organic radical activating enzyme
MTTHKYSETFFSPQGEGNYTGHSSVWIRFFLCNLQCNGFGQDDPTAPDSWELPYEKLDISDITQVEDLPVFDKGCDSSYTWAKKYRHLMHNKSASDICDELEALLPHGKFRNPQTGQDVHMCFTGGEPMLKNSQLAMVDIMQEFERRSNRPRFVTVETNGTQPLTSELKIYLNSLVSGSPFITDRHTEWFWSVSPKLWATAGEQPKKAIKPDVVRDYCAFSRQGQLKYVVNGNVDSWNEVEDNTTRFRDAGATFPVWIMASGARKEELIHEVESGVTHEAIIANEAVQKGYHFTTRAHCHIFGNQIGT